jgi:hypothetical protein
MDHDCRHHCPPPNYCYSIGKYVGCAVGRKPPKDHGLGILKALNRACTLGSAGGGIAAIRQTRKLRRAGKIIIRLTAPVKAGIVGAVRARSTLSTGFVSSETRGGT